MTVLTLLLLTAVLVLVLVLDRQQQVTVDLSWQAGYLRALRDLAESVYLPPAVSDAVDGLARRSEARCEEVRP